LANGGAIHTVTRAFDTIQCRRPCRLFQNDMPEMRQYFFCIVR